MSTPSTDDDRVLNRLLHDVRTPLGVAHGYLRMIRDQRLATPELRAKALEGVTNALSKMTRLCDEAAGRAPMDDAPASARSADAFAARLAERLPPLGIGCTIADTLPGAALRVDDAGAVLEGAVLLIRGTLPAGGRCTVGLDGPTLVVRRHDAGDPTTLLTLALETAPS
jgi:signal transduction histidine kinase